jgi:hypothetical protein
VPAEGGRAGQGRAGAQFWEQLRHPLPVLGVRTELVKTEDEDGLVDLEAKDLGLDQGKRLSVDLDEALTSLELSREYAAVGSDARALEARGGIYLAVGDSCWDRVSWDTQD